MIVRIWQGWTNHENADEYERLLTTKIIPEILSKNIQGLLEIEVLRREAGKEIEFMTIYYFESTEDIKKMAGNDPERAYVPESARKLLKRFEDTARHFEKRY
ncbi:MAG: antibiotic biosynthesis monooxygenase [Chloroflexota bacterium]